MCGIVGATAQRDIRGVLIEGLRRLEYRGYDSAGVGLVGPDGVQVRRRVDGRAGPGSHTAVPVPAPFPTVDRPAGPQGWRAPETPVEGSSASTTPAPRRVRLRRRFEPLAPARRDIVAPFRDA